MRILVLTTDAFHGHGGIARFCRDLLTALCAYPACAEVVALPRFADLASGDEQLPPKLRYVTSGLGGKLQYAAAVFREAMRRGRFDLVVCAHVNLLPFAFIAKRLHGAPLALIIYGIDAWQPTNHGLANRLIGSVDAIVSISELTRERLFAWAPATAAESFILPCTVDLQRFTPGPKPALLLDRYGLRGKRVLMTLGRMAAEEQAKGFDQVLEVLGDLSSEIPELAYLVMGDGSDRPRLQKKARALGVADRVVFTGRIDEAEKVDHYRLADAYVMPSISEGLGIVFLEAMACGVPVVGSKVDGGREALRGGKLGILVDPDDRAELRQAILVALERPRGVVPDGIEYFAYTTFERRCHALVDTIVGRNSAGANPGTVPSEKSETLPSAMVRP